MKKAVTFFLVLIVSVFCIFADQLTYRRDSKEVVSYYQLRHLCSIQSPDPVFPISGSQLLGLLKELDRSKLGDYGLELYNNLVKELEEPEHDFSYKDTSLDLEIPLYAVLKGRTSDQYIDSKMGEYLLFDIQSTDTGCGFDAKIDIGENFAGRFNFCLRINDTEKFRNNKLMFVSPFFVFNETEEVHKPYQAYISVGNKTLNLIVGRDRTSAGNGKTGNIAFGDNFVYQDFAKFSAVSYPFSYDLTIYEFDNQQGSNFNIQPVCHDEPFQAVISHRFSAAMSKHFNFSLYESTLTFGDSFAAIKAINPFHILHNTYSFNNANINNFFGVEFNFSIKNFEISINGMLDQFQFSGEIGNQPGEIAPNAVALQLNTSGVWELCNGILEAYAEGVFTSPVCYLKEIKGRNQQGVYWYQQDLLVGNLYDNPGNVGFLGYKYGPGTIAVGLGSSYKTSDWSISSDILFMERGSFGKRHDITLFGNSKKQGTEWTDEDIANGIDKIQYTFDLTDEESREYIKAFHLPITLGDEKIEYTVKATVKGSYQFDESFSIAGGFGFIHVKNFCNQDRNELNDFQFSISAKLDLFPWIVKGTHAVEKFLNL